MLQDAKLTEKIIGCSYKVYNALNFGYLEEMQLVNYLTATGVDVGLLINFGPAGVKARRKHRVYKPKQDTRS